MTITEWISQAATALKNVGIESAKLDAEIMLAHTLRKSRTYLHAYRDEVITPRERDIADARLQLRLDRTPIAYIIGHKEFYGRRFRITPTTLIPRPESETIIEVLRPLVAGVSPGSKLVDVGAGSGVLGITAKLEFPSLDVTLIDISKHALNIARRNAQGLKADVSILQADLLADYPYSPQFVVANLPYVDPAWERSPETNHEPEIALFAKDSGLSLIKQLIHQAGDRILPNGTLILEADPRQHAVIKEIAKAHGFTKSDINGFIITLRQ